MLGFWMELLVEEINQPKVFCLLATKTFQMQTYIDGGGDWNDEVNCQVALL